MLLRLFCGGLAAILDSSFFDLVCITFPPQSLPPAACIVFTGLASCNVTLIYCWLHLIKHTAVLFVASAVLCFVEFMFSKNESGVLAPRLRCEDYGSRVKRRPLGIWRQLWLVVGEVP